jgi:hypothetical protein
MAEFLPGTITGTRSSKMREAKAMYCNDHLPVTEEVEEVRAKSEDRLMDFMVPRLDYLAERVTEAAAYLRDKIAHHRPVH